MFLSAQTGAEEAKSRENEFARKLYDNCKQVANLTFSEQKNSFCLMMIGSVEFAYDRGRMEMIAAIEDPDVQAKAISRHAEFIERGYICVTDWGYWSPHSFTSSEHGVPGPNRVKTLVNWYELALEQRLTLDPAIAIQTALYSLMSNCSTPGQQDR